MDSPKSSSSVASISGERLGVAPFSSRFLTGEDLRNIASFKDDTSDKSLSSWLLSPLASYLARFVPSSLAPNVLTLMSLVAVLHACDTTYMYHDSWPKFSSAVAIVMFTLYHALDMVDGKHAKNIKNDTPLGYAFNQFCDAIGLTFIVVTMCLLLGIKDTNLIWYSVHAGHLIFLWAQLSAYNRGYLSWGLFTGPGEGLALFNSILGIRAIWGLGWFSSRLQFVAVWLASVVNRLLSFLAPTLIGGIMGLQQIKPKNQSQNTSGWLWFNNGTEEAMASADSWSSSSTSGVSYLSWANKEEFGRFIVQSVYYCLLGAVCLRVLMLPKAHKITRNYLLFSLLFRSIPGLLTGYGIASSVSLTEVVIDGLFMSILTSDLVVARMAKRELHDWILIMAMMSLLDKFVNMIMVLFYYASMIYDICTFMNLPVLTPVINVYIDGVFDLCHLGHKNHIMRALKYGNRLLVGVMSDEDVRKYKRDPIMTLDERCAEVEALRCVYKVIPGAPCFGMTKEFIDEWKIHIVLASPEYDKPDDKYYKVPRQIGILKIMPRTGGVSTSDLIKRIVTRNDEEKQASNSVRN